MMPSSRQDKLCNALTLVGLLAVIICGTVSLWPESQAQPAAQPAETLDATSEAQPTDTLPEVPLVETQPVAQPKNEERGESDSLEAAATQPVDTVHTTKHHTPATQPAEGGNHAEPVESSEKTDKAGEPGASKTHGAKKGKVETGEQKSAE